MNRFIKMICLLLVLAILQVVGLRSAKLARCNRSSPLI